MSRRTLSQGKALSSSARSLKPLVTSCAEAVLSTLKKLQSLSHTTLPLPQNGRVWRASRSFFSASSGCPLFDTEAPQPFRFSPAAKRSEEHTSELQSPDHLAFPLPLEKSNQP